jgi:hypothetical protein
MVRHCSTDTRITGSSPVYVYLLVSHKNNKHNIKDYFTIILVHSILVLIKAPIA